MSFVSKLIAKVDQAARWRLGLRVADPQLEGGDDSDVSAFYNSRVTHCEFLSDPAHYEFPRAEWILRSVRGARLLEIGCGDGGMTRLLAPGVRELVALDVSRPSLEKVRLLGLSNVTIIESLVESFKPDAFFDCVVMSEVLEHLRNPRDLLRSCFEWVAPGGELLITTPHGHWESNEHLQEFDLESLAAVVACTGAEEIQIRFIRDSSGRRRWLAAKAIAGATAPTPDDFNSRMAIVAKRRRT